MQDRIDAEKLLTTSDLHIRAGQAAWRHLHAEYRDVVDEILDTLAPSGPYAYTLSPVTEENRAVPVQRITTTYDGIAQTYRDVHRFAAVVGLRPLTEITGSWYTFVYGAALGRAKEVDGQRPVAVLDGESEVIVLFPTMGSEGITGELYWARTKGQEALTGNPADGPRASRHAVEQVHAGLVEAHRKGDIDTLIEMAHPETQTALRDYVGQTGTLVELDGRNELREFLRDFHAQYTVRDIEIVHRHFDDWFFFHELRWTLEVRRGPDSGSILRHHTAEYGEVAEPGVVVSRIGHGTDQIKIG
ncbi:hypothetical protein ACWD4G_36780 [Streptomyces sp. NPDC002643]